ncbi:hypothetical protein [Streptomyces ziwulingensis]
MRTAPESGVVERLAALQHLSGNTAVVRVLRAPGRRSAPTGA